MSTSAHVSANPAQSAPLADLPRGGPRTEEGKANSSKNAITHGLYAQRDFIRPAEEEDYSRDKAELAKSLAPEGPLEVGLVNEIHRAMWRLRRCGQVEANIAIGLDNGGGYIFDPMETTNLHAEKTQRSVDRARAQAHRLLHKCTAELRMLQTDRRYRTESGVLDSGICDLRAVVKALNSNRAATHRQRDIKEIAELEAGIPITSSFCKQPIRKAA